MRKAVPAVALTVAVVLVAAGVTAYYVSHNGLPGSNNSQCGDPDSRSSHVYNPYRLTIVKSCIIASGVVDNVLQEIDGDYHVRLRLDSQYSNLTNPGNSSSHDQIGLYSLERITT